MNVNIIKVASSEYPASLPATDIRLSTQPAISVPIHRHVQGIRSPWGKYLVEVFLQAFVIFAAYCALDDLNIIGNCSPQQLGAVASLRWDSLHRHVQHNK